MFNKVTTKTVLQGLKAVTFVVPPNAQQRNDTSISTDAEKRSDTSILTDAEKMSDTSILTDAEKISDTGILTDAEKISDTSILTDAEIRMSYEKVIFFVTSFYVVFIYIYHNLYYVNSG